MQHLATASHAARLARDARIGADYADILALRASYQHSRTLRGQHTTHTHCRCGITTTYAGDCIACHAPD